MIWFRSAIFTVALGVVLLLLAACADRPSLPASGPVVDPPPAYVVLGRVRPTLALCPEV